MFPVADLIALARSLAVDTDHSLGQLSGSSLVLLNLKPQPYPVELHQETERILVLQGEAGVEFEQGAVRLTCGALLVVPPGQRHSFSADSDAVVLAIFGDPDAAAAPAPSC
ncbi:cupin domain [Pseudomonas sp. SJZ079]|uniref:cupin domain-containing protein n=1 Tax=Pseudomonas sp. SJZ079 TaxID=2572887 RepID=UPI00119B189A|nr:cupin domain-containing protein [Pseudomonas sp. SJZ079]TWC28027.1 cupin domain [Pseudomonas sp. SJZ079]